MTINTNVIFRKDKIKSNNTAPIHIRFTLNRKIRYASTGITIHISDWDFENQRIKGNNPEMQELQYRIDTKLNEYRRKIKRLEALEVEVELTGRKGEALEKYKRIILKLNNDVVAEAPQDLTINTHVCRGNYHSTFFSSGAYDGVADLLFGEENVNAYYLEFDDERSGGFGPLAKISGDKKVVLGLITTKKPDLENKKEIVERIKQAAQYIPLDRLYLSPQCGFASCEIGNKLTEEEQWAKLKLVKEIAEEVWK